MKLISGNKEIEVEITVPTRTARKELRKLDKKKGERFDKLNKEFKDVTDYYQKDDEGKKEMVKANPKIPQRTFDYIDGVTEIGEDILIEQCKAMIRKDKLRDEDSKLVASEPKSDFWMEQDMKEIQEAVSSFRGVLREGRSEDTPVT